MNDIMQNIAFPYNLFKEVGIGRAELPKDAEATLYYVLYSECRNDREADVTLMRYRDNISLQEIGNAYLLSAERVHTITLSCLQRLRREENLKPLSTT